MQRRAAWQSWIAGVALAVVLVVAPAADAARWPTAPPPTALKGRDVHALARSGAVVVAGTDRGAYRSPDGGRTWRRAGLPGEVRAIAVDRRNPKRLFASVGPDLFRSTDRGASWTPAAPFSVAPTTAVIIAIAAAGPTVIVGTDVGAWLSRDGGATWSATNPGRFGPVIGVAIQPTNGAVWAATGEGAALLGSTGFWSTFGPDYGIPTNPGPASVVFPGGPGNPIFVSRCGDYYSIDEAQLGQFQFDARGRANGTNIVTCGPAVAAPLKRGVVLVPGRAFVGVCSNDSGCFPYGKVSRGRVLSVAVGDPARRGRPKRFLIGTTVGLTTLELPRAGFR